SSPWIRIVPPVGRSSPAIMFSSVDLPHPDGPITATASPVRTSSVTPSSATVSLYSLRTPSSRTTTSFVMPPTLGTLVLPRHRSADATSRRCHPGDVRAWTPEMMWRAARVCHGDVVESATLWLSGALVVACATALWLGVALARARRRHHRALEQRGWLLEREREAAARTAVDAERARIARELHDIVSHNVSLMIVQAAAAREVLATMPGEAAEALAAIEG